MKTNKACFRGIGSAVLLALAIQQASAQAPVIGSLSRNGELVGIHLEPTTSATVEWAPSLDGPWSSSWDGLSAITVPPDGTIRLSVPMFYRLRGIPAKPNPEKLAWIPPGTFVMGSPPAERGRETFPFADETQREVTLSRGFWMGKYEVTIDEYRAFLLAGGDQNGVDWGSADCPILRDSSFSLRGNNVGQSGTQPMVEVSWYGARAYCQWLTQTERAAELLLPEYEYRLPTEAQWEYACRAGTTTRFSFGDVLECNNDSSCDFCAEMDRYMWWCGNSGNQSQPVGQKLPNPWGLYDIHGNVREWCSGWLGDYPTGSLVDPTGPASGTSRVYRGGNWVQSAQEARCAFRIYDLPTDSWRGLGFRVALVPIP